MLPLLATVTASDSSGGSMRKPVNECVRRSCRDIEARELDRVRGGTVVITGTGPGDGPGPKLDDDPGVIIISDPGGDGPGPK
jgi:hypothetical protein